MERPQAAPPLPRLPERGRLRGACRAASRQTNRTNLDRLTRALARAPRPAPRGRPVPAARQSGPRGAGAPRLPVPRRHAGRLRGRARRRHDRLHLRRRVICGCRPGRLDRRGRRAAARTSARAAPSRSPPSRSAAEPEARRRSPQRKRRPPSHAPNPSPRRMAEAPAWARSLVLTVCAEADAPLPRLSWRHRDRPTSSGVTRQSAGAISVVAGRDPVDQRLTLLHELAHWLAPAAAAWPPADPPPRRGLLHDGLRALPPPRRSRCRRPGRRVGPLSQLPRPRATAGRPRRGSGLARAPRGRFARGRSAGHRCGCWCPEHGVRLVRDGRWTRCAVCGIRVVGPNLRRLRRRPGRHVLLGIA